MLDSYGRLYYAAANTRRQRLAATAVAAAWLNERLEDCRARRQILVLDCCHSGAFAKGAKGDSHLALQHRFEPHGRGRVVLTASRSTEYSFEGGQASGEGVPSVFTHAMVNGLRTGDADRDKDGLITVTDLYQYVYDNVRAAEPRQTPELWTYGAEGNLLVAHSIRGAVIEPEPLPEDLRITLESPRRRVRETAVAELADLLDSASPGLALTARQTLERIAEEDHPQVAELAGIAVGAPAGSAAGRVRRELAARAHREEEEQARQEAARRQAEERAQHEAEEAARRQAEERAQHEAEEAARRQAEERAQHEAEEAARRQAEERAQSVLADQQATAPATPVSQPDRRPTGKLPDGGAPAPRSWGKPLPSPSVPAQQRPVGDELAQLEHGGAVNAVAFSPDGLFLATGSADGPRIWDLTTSPPRPRRLQPDGRIHALAFSPDGTLLAAGGADKKCRLWSVDTGRQQASLPHENAVTALAFSQDSARLITRCADNSASAWEVDSKKILNQLPPFTPPAIKVQNIAIRQPGEVGADKSMKNVTSLLAQLNRDRSDELDMDSSRLLREAAQSRRIAETTATSAEETQQAAAHIPWPTVPPAISPDGSLLAMVRISSARSVELWETMTGLLRPPLEIDGWVQAFAFSPDSRQLATAVGLGDQAGAQLWDMATGKRLARMAHKHEIHGRHSPVDSVAFSPDGAMLASGGKTICLWQISPRGLRGIHIGGGRPSAILPFNQLRVKAITMAFSPDGSRLAIVNGRGMSLWDVASKQRLTQQVHEAEVRAFAFSPDGRQLVTISGSTARLWAAHP